MRVGVYIDGYNIYYGGRARFGRGSVGWKWYSPKNMARQVINEVLTTPNITSQGRVHEIWQGASVHRTVFCTAKIPDVRDPQAAHDQEMFLKAIDEDAHVDTLEMGRYVSRVKYAPLAVRGEDRQPQVVNPSWPVKVSTGSHEHLDDAVFMVSYLHNEEKGSDVNVATHLLRDVFEGEVDAAVVISNDTDLSLPLAVVRERVPVGVVHPGTGYVHGSLRGQTDRHKGDWFIRPSDRMFTDSQMPADVAGWRKPKNW